MGLGYELSVTRPSTDVDTRTKRVGSRTDAGAGTEPRGSITDVGVRNKPGGKLKVLGNKSNGTWSYADNVRTRRAISRGNTN